MAFFLFDSVAIIGISTAVPKNRVYTEDFIEQFGEKHIRKFIKTTGVKERRVALEHQTASDLGYVAARNLLIKKNIPTDDLGILVFASHGPDYRRPATACVLQHRLGLSESCACFDINLGCSAFVYAIQTVSAMLCCSNVEHALLIVGDTNTKITYSKDESMVLLTGDAASAILLEKRSGSSLAATLISEGDKWKNIIVPAGGFRNLHGDNAPMIFADGIERTLYHLFMDGFGVFQWTIGKVPEIICNHMESARVSIEGIDCFGIHQANKYILEQLKKRLKIPEEKIPISLEKYGNTSSASVPLTLCNTYGKIQSGKVNVLICGFGVGLSCGVMNTMLQISDIYPIIETDEYFEEGLINTPLDWL